MLQALLLVIAAGFWCADSPVILRHFKTTIQAA